MNELINKILTRGVEEIIPKEEFIENLESTQFALLRAFFETMPAIENELKFVCKSCEKENVVYLNGYFDFFV